MARERLRYFKAMVSFFNIYTCAYMFVCVIFEVQACFEEPGFVFLKLI